MLTLEASRLVPTDPADAAALVAVASATQGATFTACDLHRLALVDPVLRNRLRAADVTFVREIGEWCRRVRGVPIAGLMLQQVGRHRDGRVWIVATRGDSRVTRPEAR